MCTAPQPWYSCDECMTQSQLFAHDTATQIRISPKITGDMICICRKHTLKRERKKKKKHVLHHSGVTSIDASLIFRKRLPPRLLMRLRRFDQPISCASVVTPVNPRALKRNCASIQTRWYHVTTRRQVFRRIAELSWS